MSTKTTNDTENMGQSMTHSMSGIRQAAQLIQAAQSVVAFTGAGISTPSGIPDFRSKISGLWEKHDPMEVASIYGFRQNPNAFFDWVRPLAQATLDAQPNPAHHALYQLERMGKLDSIITQNIDMLHSHAGNTTVYELHGHLREATCVHCFTRYDGEPLIRDVLETGDVPHCPKCRAVIKPNVILFGEQLPYQQVKYAKDAARSCDVMIIVGSSLEVYPASELPLLASRRQAKLIVVNYELTDIDSIADVVIREDIATVLPAIVEELEFVE